MTKNIIENSAYSNNQVLAGFNYFLNQKLHFIGKDEDPIITQIIGYITQNYNEFIEADIQSVLSDMMDQSKVEEFDSLDKILAKLNQVKLKLSQSLPKLQLFNSFKKLQQTAKYLSSEGYGLEISPGSKAKIIGITNSFSSYFKNIDFGKIEQNFDLSQLEYLFYGLEFLIKNHDKDTRNLVESFVQNIETLDIDEVAFVSQFKNQITQEIFIIGYRLNLSYRLDIAQQLLQARGSQLEVQEWALENVDAEIKIMKTSLENKFTALNSLNLVKTVINTIIANLNDSIDRKALFKNDAWNDKKGFNVLLSLTFDLLFGCYNADLDSIPKTDHLQYLYQLIVKITNETIAGIEYMDDFFKPEPEVKSVEAEVVSNDGAKRPDLNVETETDDFDRLFEEAFGDEFENMFNGGDNVAGETINGDQIGQVFINNSGINIGSFVNVDSTSGSKTKGAKNQTNVYVHNPNPNAQTYKGDKVKGKTYAFKENGRHTISCEKYMNLKGAKVQNISYDKSKPYIKKPGEKQDLEGEISFIDGRAGEKFVVEANTMVSIKTLIGRGFEIVVETGAILRVSSFNAGVIKLKPGATLEIEFYNDFGHNTYVKLEA